LEDEVTSDKIFDWASIADRCEEFAWAYDTGAEATVLGSFLGNLKAAMEPIDWGSDVKTTD